MSHHEKRQLLFSLAIDLGDMPQVEICIPHTGIGLDSDRVSSYAADDFLGHIPLVGRFYQVIVTAADNEFINQCLGKLHAPLIRHQFRIILVPGRKDESLAEHRDILIAVEQRDAAGAEQAMRRHVAQLCHAMQHASRLPFS